MKIIKLISSLSIIISLTMSCTQDKVQSYHQKSSNADTAQVASYEVVDFLPDYLDYNGYKPLDGYIPNEETAIKIAETILFKIYGKNEIYEQRPYKILLKDDTLWCIEGNLPIDMDGGVFYIEIKKDSGKILKVVHGK